jgi:hypothetical protein
MGNFGNNLMPSGPEWTFDAYAWGNIYNTVHCQVALSNDSVGPVVWGMSVMESWSYFGLTYRSGDYNRIDTSPLGAYHLVDQTSADPGGLGLAAMPGTLNVSAP